MCLLVYAGVVVVYGGFITVYYKIIDPPGYCIYIYIHLMQRVLTEIEILCYLEK